MKYVAILMNIVQFIVAILVTIYSELDYLLCGIFLVTPLVSVYCLLFGVKLPDTWIMLYFKRKALEEKTKIEQLAKKD